jgi:hypothetical protein
MMTAATQHTIKTVMPLHHMLMSGRREFLECVISKGGGHNIRVFMIILLYTDNRPTGVR